MAVAIELDTGEVRYVMTWGRIQDRVLPGPLEAIVLQHASKLDLGGNAVGARVCYSLQDARDEPYFFEVLFEFSQRPIPFGEGYDAWRRVIAEAQEDGKEISYLGRPRSLS